MLEALLATRVLLAIVFGVAAAAKLASPAAARDALRQFGTRNWLVAPLAWCLPIAELGVSVGLLSNTSARWAGVAALVLLVVFVGGIAVNLARGKHPDCHCFGQLHATPVGWTTLLRNGFLMVCAGVVVWQGPGLDAGLWLAGLSGPMWLTGIVATLLVAVIVVEGWFLLNLVSQQGRLLLRLEALEASTGGPPLANAGVNPIHAGLATGTRAPDFELPWITGGSATLRGLLESNRPLLLVFSDPGCGPCNALLPELGSLQREHSNKLNITFVSSGDLDINRAKAREFRLSHVLLQKNREVATRFRYAGTPSGVLIGADGLIASPVVAGADALRALVTRTVGQPTSVRVAQHLPVVARAPS